MQNKKSLLKRLLFLYIAFFLILVTGIVHNLLGDFGRGAETGVMMGEKIAETIQQGAPRQIYLLGDIHVIDQPDGLIRLRNGDTEVEACITRLNLLVDKPSQEASPVGLAFRSVGGNGWIYLLTLLIPVLFLAIIVLMIMIIHSLRRSIREERTLDRRNVWYLRTIGLLTIVSELVNGELVHTMSLRAAELLNGSGFTVDTAFDISYSTIIMGILILFSAEVFAIGQNLSEEQKLTI